MGRRNRPRPPLAVVLDRLDPKGPSGLDERGRRHVVRTGAVGATLEVRAGRKGKAERMALLDPAPDQVEPVCPVFGTCGGCQLQEMPLARQREEKTAMVARQVGHPCAPCEGSPAATGYRNKLELSWSPRRYLADVPTDRALVEGSWLGFHPPGWYSRVVSVEDCPLGTPAMNQVIATVLAQGCAPAWDNTSHQGAWRHIVLRQGEEGVLVTLVTSSACPEAEVRALGEQLARLDVCSGVLWRVNDGLAEVATGELRAVLHGKPDLRMRAGARLLRLPPEAFFQVNTDGAALLFDRIAQALVLPGDPPSGRAGVTLVDLYCGVGAIGLALADRFDGIVGIELLESAVETARDNAAANGVTGSWYAGPVEEVLPTLDLPAPRRVVVDPPRVGLHPKAAAYLAGLEAEVLVYVACSPASLGRDRVILEEGGWVLDGLWAVDLFPQTRHVEAIARFLRP